jgi:hypothetical protein
LHECVVVLQVWPAGQSDAPRHPTHAFVAVSHTGVTSVHAVWLDAVHVTQAPVEAHARPWVLAEQSLSPAQPRHVSRGALAVLQTGAGLLHSESFTHCAQVCVAVSHALLAQSVFCTHPTHTPA